MRKIALKGGFVVDPSQDLDERRDILVEGDTILDLPPSVDLAEGVEVIDVTGKTVAPGFIDLHVHLREPGQEEKETIASGISAAVAGGVTSLCCMPNTIPVVDNKVTVDWINRQARKTGLARIYPIGALTRGQLGKQMADYGSLTKAGVKAFSDDGKFVSSSRIMYDAMICLKELGTPVISHCEDESLAGQGSVHQGLWSQLLELPGVPSVSETMAVARDVLLAEATGARLHIAHVSCAGSLEWIRRAKDRGVKVTAEVTPHHLLLTSAAVEGYNTMAKMRPPLREESDRDALLQALRDGLIDIIATDHAPHTMEEKGRSFGEAPFGVTGLDFALSLLLTEFVQTGKMTLKQLIKSYSCRPAEIMGLPGGTLKKGSPADMTVLDLEARDVIDPDRFYSRGKNTPFAGRVIRGKPVMTLVGGKIVMEAGKVLKPA